MSPMPIRPAFEFEGLSIRLDRLLPSKALGERVKESAKYQTLLASVREVGIVEPLNVFPQKGGRYLILDGHLRVEALRDLGFSEAPCLIATQDDGYTYNQKISRIAQIQANRMILKALDAGVSEERIARALNISVQSVRSNRRLLQDICPEAVEILKDKQVARETLGLLRRVKPLRQIEIAEILAAAGNYTATYTRALLVTTPREQFVHPDNPRKVPGVKPDDLARIEYEIRIQEKDFRMLDETYNENVMALTLARGYLRPLLENNRVVRFLAQHYAEYLSEFQRIVEASSLER